MDAVFRQFGDSFLCTRTAFWVQLTEIAVGTAMKRTAFQAMDGGNDGDGDKKQRKMLFMHSGDGGTGSGGQLFWGYKVETKTSLTTHLLNKPKATQVATFRCEVCDKGFKSSSGLLGHKGSKAHLDKEGLKDRIEAVPEQYLFLYLRFCCFGQPLKILNPVWSEAPS